MRYKITPMKHSLPKKRQYLLNHNEPALKTVISSTFFYKMITAFLTRKGDYRH